MLFLLLYKFDVLTDDMFGDVGALVNEHWVGSDIVKGFDSVIVAQIAVDRGLGMSHLASYGGGIFALEHDFANGLGFVRDGHVTCTATCGTRPGPNTMRKRVPSWRALIVRGP